MPAHREPPAPSQLGADPPPVFELPGSGIEGGEMLLTESASGPVLRQPAPGGRSRWRRLGWGFWVATGWVVLMIVLAVFAGFIGLQDPNTPSATCLPDAGPSAAHWLGCDNIGRDILARVIYGGRVSLIVGFASIALGLVVGGSLGVLSGYVRGWLDGVFGILSNTFLAFPSLVLSLLIVAFLGNSLIDIVVIIAIVAWPLLFRVVRAATIEYAAREYVLAARALGAKTSRVLFTLILPDVIPSALTYGLVGVALAVVGEGALSFLGQSVSSPTATWGNMIAQGSQNMQQHVSLLVSPAVAMFTFILAINFIGDRLRGVLDVRDSAL